ncbi:MAG: flagellar export chaperone FlgN [Planctomycetales bacterium]|nr:flagellar export chaperone FlgN [Planctomycetales bacterium]
MAVNRQETGDTQVNDRDTTPRPSADLYDACMRHLDEEIKTLERLNRMQHDLRGALRQADASALAETLDAQAQAGDLLAPLRCRRQALRDRIAEELRWPRDAATIQRLAIDAEPTVRIELLARRERLNRLVAEQQQLAQGNALLTRNWSELIQMMFAKLTGVERTSGCYGSQGQLTEQVATSVFQTRC